MSTGNGNGNNNEEKKLSPTELAIVEMMKKQNLQRARPANGELNDEQRAHAFWDTQVRPIYNKFADVSCSALRSKVRELRPSYSRQSTF
jgi:hypothetical protein